jgi:hypothetical protein
MSVAAIKTTQSSQVARTLEGRIELSGLIRRRVISLE